MIEYDPADWFWIVGGDESRYWSSAARGYVASPPEGAGVTRIADEQELTDVLATYDLPGPLYRAPDLQPWQFRAMLKLSGKEADLLAFLDQLPGPQQTVAKAKLEYTLVFRRDNDLVLSAQQALGLTDQELDDLWTAAASL